MDLVDYYYIPGTVTLSQGNVAKIFKAWGKSYSIIFDIKITKPGNTWINVFTITSDEFAGDYETRIPSLAIMGHGNKFRLEHDTKAKNNDGFSFPPGSDYELNKVYHVNISHNDGTDSLRLDGEEIYKNEAGSPPPGIFPEVKLYLSYKKFPTFADYGIISDLLILQFR